jgi:hypothetical protein
MVGPVAPWPRAPTAQWRTGSFCMDAEAALCFAMRPIFYVFAASGSIRSWLFEREEWIANARRRR